MHKLKDEETKQDFYEEVMDRFKWVEVLIKRYIPMFRLVDWVYERGFRDGAAGLKSVEEIEKVVRYAHAEARAGKRTDHICGILGHLVISWDKRDGLTYMEPVKQKTGE